MVDLAHRQVIFRSAARDNILRGSAQLADSDRVTLGPKSNSVVIQSNWGSVASFLLLTEATMTDLPEPKPEGSTAPDMGM
ncbi:MAG: hypothetical protein ACM3L9_11660 [Deltaproteobacteria bacterium]